MMKFIVVKKEGLYIPVKEIKSIEICVDYTELKNKYEVERYKFDIHRNLNVQHVGFFYNQNNVLYLHGFKFFTFDECTAQINKFLEFLKDPEAQVFELEG